MATALGRWPGAKVAKKSVKFSVIAVFTAPSKSPMPPNPRRNTPWGLFSHFGCLGWLPASSVRVRLEYVVPSVAAPGRLVPLKFIP